MSFGTLGKFSTKMFGTIYTMLFLSILIGCPIFSTNQSTQTKSPRVAYNYAEIYRGMDFHRPITSDCVS